MRTSLRRCALVTAAFFTVILGGPSLLADQPQFNPIFCPVDGTWYGGGDVTKYLMTITRSPGLDYTLVFNGAYTLPGVAVFTPVTGSVIRKGLNRYEVFAIGLSNATTGVPAPYPDLTAVHAVLRFVDCNTVKLEFDFFGAYYASSWQNGKVPFIDAADPIPLPPTPFTETYRRMPTTCAVCSKS